jgi:HAD superfamily hydrolase (TIGR01549 family)
VANAVLFDFGGTLDADGVAWKERFGRLYQAEGLALDSERFDPLFYAADDALAGTIPATLSFRETVFQLAAAVSEGLGVGAEDRLSGRVASQFLEDALAKLRANRGMLERLRRRYALGVVSNFYGNLVTVCEEAGLRRLFSVIIDSRRVGCQKPDPRIFDRAVHELGMRPGDATFVGDSLARDMVGARAAGMSHVWLAGAARRERNPCCPADRVITSLAELEAIL